MDAYYKFNNLHEYVISPCVHYIIVPMYCVCLVKKWSVQHRLDSEFSQIVFKKSLYIFQQHRKP